MALSLRTVVTPAGRAGLVALALFAAGCSSTRVASVDTRPDPLPAAPETEVASLPPAPAANAPDLTPGSVAGVWGASVAGQSCRVATPQTKFGQGFRAGPLRCPAPLDGVKSWNVAGKQLTLYDANGGQIASLFSSGPGKFDGQTGSGQPISLSR